MISPADIIVTSPDFSEITLVAETKLAVEDLQEAEFRLKRYMVQVNCPVGLLLTPGKLRIYSDQYISNSSDSVRLVGEFDIPKILSFHSEDPNSGGSEDLFEQRVQEWLQGLATSLEISNYESPLKEALRKYVVPSISGGIVRAGGPHPARSKKN